MGDTGKQIPSVNQRYKRSGITSARQMNNIGREINKLSMSPDLAKTPTGYRYKASASTPYPFQVIRDTTYSATALERRVSIRGGIFEVIHAYSASHADTMQVTPLTIDTTTPQVTGNFTGAGSLPTELAKMTNGTIASGATRWIYLIVGNSTIIGELKQASNLFAYVSADATRPDEDVIDNPSNPGFELDPKSVKVLAKVVNTDGKLTITQEWTGGNIKEVAVGLDTYDGYNQAPGQLSKSLFYDQYGRESLYGFDAWLEGHVGYASVDVDGNRTLTPYYANTIDSLPTSIDALNIMRDPSTSGTYLTWYGDTYAVGVGVDGMSTWTKDGSRSGSLDLTSLVIAIGDVPGAFDHGALDGLSDDDHDTGDARYVRTNGDATRNDFEVGSMIGDNAKANSLSPDLRTLYGIWHSNETDASDSDVTLNSFYSLGGIGVTNGIYSTKGTGNQALLATDGTRTSKLADGSYAADFADGSFTARFATGTNAGVLTDFLSNEVRFCDGVFSVNARVGRINSVDGYSFNGTEGVTGDGFSGGIKTDSDESDAYINSLIEHYL